MLTQISIEGFRGYSRKQSMRPAIPNGAPGSGLTLVTGPNNSGKSTLLEVLKIRGQNAPSFHVGQRNELTDFVTLEFEFDTHLETVCSLKKGSSESVSTNCKINEAPVYYVPSRRHINHSFGKNYGVLIEGGPFDRVHARAVFVVGPDDKLKYVEYVSEIANHPDYDAVLAAAK